MALLERVTDLLRFGRREAVALTLLLLAAGACWAFVELADEVVEGGTQGIDERILLSLRASDDPSDPIGPGWIEEMGRDLTALGGMTVLGLLSLAVCGLLWLLGKRRAVLLVVVAESGGLLLSMVMKGAFDRPRPDLVPHGSIVYTASFPSGHSMMAAVTYLTLAALLTRFLPGRAVKIYVLAVAVLVMMAVGISRVYLGVHWPSDVLAGWTAGAAWALMCWLVTRQLQRRGQVEADPEPEVAAAD